MNFKRGIRSCLSTLVLACWDSCHCSFFGALGNHFAGIINIEPSIFVYVGLAAAVSAAALKKTLREKN